MPRVNRTAVAMAHAFALAMPLAAAAQPGIREGTWTPLPDLPEPISNNAVTSVDHGDGTWSVYTFMGMTPPGLGPNSTVASYRLDWSETDGPLGPWVPIADAPLLNNRAKVAASAVTAAGAVYLIGGYTTLGLSEVTEERLFRYEPATDTYTELAPVPTEVDDTVPAVYRDRYIYLISGWHGPINDNTTAVQLYDTQTNTWQQATPIPGPEDGLFGHAGGIIEDQTSGTLVFIDGTTSAGSFNISNAVYTGRIDPSDPTSIAWTEQPAHPGRPTYRAAAALTTTPNNKLLIVGGTDNPYNLSGVGYNRVFSTPLDQALAYDAATNTWTRHTLTGRPATMDHRNLAPLGDGFVIVGGMFEPIPTSAQMTPTAWRLTIDPCRADFDSSGTIDGNDLTLWYAAFLAGEERADQNGDGLVNPSDYFALVVRAGRGCL
ncbi:MAG: kelch repeat-containing protein [Planctomycetota bacterium]